MTNKVTGEPYDYLNGPTRHGKDMHRLGCRRCGGWGHIWLGNRDRETCELCHGTGADPDQPVPNGNSNNQ